MIVLCLICFFASHHEREENTTTDNKKYENDKKTVKEKFQNTENTPPPRSYPVLEDHTVFGDGAHLLHMYEST